MLGPQLIGGREGQEGRGEEEWVLPSHESEQEDEPEKGQEGFDGEVGAGHPGEGGVQEGNEGDGPGPGRAPDLHI